MNTYKEMNEKIVGLLELSDEPMHLYAAQRIKELEASLTPAPVVQETGDMTAAEYFNGAGSPLTLDKTFTPIERDFLLEHIELYAKGKINQALNANKTNKL